MRGVLVEANPLPDRKRDNKATARKFVGRERQYLRAVAEVISARRWTTPSVSLDRISVAA
jgi:hypothetical protein